MPDDEVENNRKGVEKAPNQVELQQSREQTALTQYVEQALGHIENLRARHERQPELSDAEKEAQTSRAVTEIARRLDEVARLAQEQMEAEQRAVVEELGVLGRWISPPDIRVDATPYGQQLREGLTRSLSLNTSDRRITDLELSVMLLNPTTEELSQILRRPDNDRQLMRVSNWILQHPSDQNLEVLLDAKRLYLHEAATLLLERDVPDALLYKIIRAPIVSGLRDEAIEQLDRTNTPEVISLILERGSRHEAEKKADELLKAGSVPVEQLRHMVRRLPAVADRAARELLKQTTVSAEDLRVIVYRSPAAREQAIDRLMAQAHPTIPDLIAAAHSSRAEIQNRAWDKAKKLITTVNAMGPVLSAWPHHHEEVWRHLMTLNPTINQLDHIIRYPLPQDQADRLIAYVLQNAAQHQPSLSMLSFIVHKGSDENAARAGGMILEHVGRHTRFGMAEEMSMALILRLNNPQLQMRALRFVLDNHSDSAHLAMMMTLSQGTEQMQNLVKEHLLRKTTKSAEEWSVLLRLDQSAERDLFQNPDQVDVSLFPLLSEERQRQMLQLKQRDPAFIRQVIPEVQIGWIRQAASLNAIWNQLVGALEDYRDELILNGYRLNRYMPDVMTGGLTVRRYDFNQVLQSNAFKSYIQQTAPAAMTFGESFSVIKAVIHTLKADKREITDANIAAVLERINTARQAHLNTVIMDGETKLILATHRERRFDNEQIIAMMQRAGFNRETNLVASVKGVELNEQGQNNHKKTILDAVKNAKTGRYTFVFSGHGTREAIWFSDGAQPTTTEQRADDPRCISYQELGAALVESGNVANIRILGMSCLSYDFMMNLNAYLAEHLPENKRQERPIMVSAANRNSLASGGGLYVDARYLSAIRELHQKDQPLRLGDLMRAESRLMMMEDPAIFVPDAEAPLGILEMASYLEPEEGADLETTAQAA